MQLAHSREMFVESFYSAEGRFSRPTNVCVCLLPPNKIEHMFSVVVIVVVVNMQQTDIYAHYI